MEWFNKYAPGLIFVGSKPNPLGNEKHTTCFGLTYVLWRSQIVEVRDNPQQIDNKEYNKLGKMVSLMLRMNIPIFVSGKDVVLNRGFCASKGITQFKTKGVFSEAMIENWRYWQK